MDIMIYNMDCIEGMKMLDDKSIDMVLVDPPYGTTACRWDNVIPFEPMWEQINRIIKDDSAVVIFGNQPFTSELIHSNIHNFKYSWIWNKNRGGNFVHANYQPLKIHEDICVFGSFPITYNKKERRCYNPQMEDGKPYSRGKINDVVWNGRDVKCGHIHNNKDGKRYPKSIININNKNNKSLHPTQKPVELFKYLIKTYTNENDLVLDFCIGSGTTAIACLETNRRYVGFELDEEYFKLANDRIERWHNDI
jgi:site-specific DNA-methyltransferase (adenine-specific)